LSHPHSTHFTDCNVYLQGVVGTVGRREEWQKLPEPQATCLMLR
jgi:hypothetical protein